MDMWDYLLALSWVFLHWTLARNSQVIRFIVVPFLKNRAKKSMTSKMLKMRCWWGNNPIVATQRPQISLFDDFQRLRKAKPAHHQVIHRCHSHAEQKIYPRLPWNRVWFLLGPATKKQQLGDVPWASSMNAEVWWSTWLAPKVPPLFNMETFGCAHVHVWSDI